MRTGHSGGRPVAMQLLCFFFSSRRRHTRCSRDWSSDVCSSDLMFFLSLSSNTSALNSIFFGLWLFPFGLLVIKSGFIPQILGYFLIIAGCSYVVGSLNFVLSPPFSPVVSSIVTVGYLGELAIVALLGFKAAQVQFGGTNSQVLRNDAKSDSKLEGGNAW